MELRGGEGSFFTLPSFSPISRGSLATLCEKDYAQITGLGFYAQPELMLRHGKNGTNPYEARYGFMHVPALGAVDLSCCGDDWSIYTGTRHSGW